VSRGRPSFYHRGGDRRRGYGLPYGYGVGYDGLDYGWLDADDSGYGGADDSGYGYDGSNDMGPYDDGSGVAAEGYAAPEPPADDQPVPYTAENAEPMPVERASRVVTAGSLYNDDAVTLVFKDGRTPEKIHNYALTRTTLYVTDGRRREIPVAALDLAATEQANRAAGVNFQLPVTQ
jgi:hypothetical protein